MPIDVEMGMKVEVDRDMQAVGSVNTWANSRFQISEVSPPGGNSRRSSTFSKSKEEDDDVPPNFQFQIQIPPPRLIKILVMAPWMWISAHWVKRTSLVDSKQKSGLRAFLDHGLEDRFGS
eukprot:TRINITY_DN12391_c1_g1_i3.p1 TRINITY_DN12391_c1_g1~~TRINITY_DN12391_c1_g1_i3.p1  ORF type:complete len:120 (-),score=20.39 TRINITY_DN12391_c1_g1_i3:2052-2411(-)